VSRSPVVEPPPLPVRRKAVAVRYFRLAEIAAAIVTYAYHVPVDFVARAMLAEAPELSRFRSSDPQAS
jgi:hypothetical protein